jgi:hypothetical protein
METPEWLVQIGTILQLLWALLVRLFGVVVMLLPLIIWCVWFLWGVNWKKAWPVLAGGAWVPVVLLMAIATLAWSRLQPEPYSFLGLVTLPNVWWQLISVSALVALALFCGFVQGYFGWTPQEIDLEPPAAAEGHGGHAHH